MIHCMAAFCLTEVHNTGQAKGVKRESLLGESREIARIISDKNRQRFSYENWYLGVIHRRGAGIAMPGEQSQPNRLLEGLDIPDHELFWPKALDAASVYVV